MATNRLFISSKYFVLLKVKLLCLLFVLLGIVCLALVKYEDRKSRRNEMLARIAIQMVRHHKFHEENGSRFLLIECESDELFGKYLRSMFIGFWIALATNRSLIITSNTDQNHSACHLDRIYKQNSIYRKFINKSLIHAINVTTYNDLEIGSNSDSLIKLNFNSLFVIQMDLSENLADRVNLLAKYRLIRFGDTFALIYKKYFRLVDDLEHQMNAILDLLRPTKSTLVICGSFQLNQSTTSLLSAKQRSFDNFEHLEYQVSEFWRFVRRRFLKSNRLILRAGKNFKIFLATNNNYVLMKAQEMHGRDVIFMNRDPKFRADHFYLEFHLYEHCDMLVLTADNLLALYGNYLRERSSDISSIVYIYDLIKIRFYQHFK